MSSKTYRSEAAAYRGAASVSRLIPQARCEVEGSTLTVYAYEAVLTPAQREGLGNLGIELTAPPKPSPDTPMFERRTRPPNQEVSLVPNAMETCREVYGRFHEEGRLDDRLDAIEAAVARGVARNTAVAYYARVRLELDLPASVRSHRRQKDRRARVELGAKRPLGQQVKHGVTEPTPGTISREVWDVADALTRKLGRAAKRPEVRDQLPYVNEHSLQRYHKLWRRFHYGRYANKGKNT